MEFVNLFVKSEYSMLDSTCAISRLVQDAVKKGYKSLAITDEAVMHGTIKFYEACIKNDIKPIIGLKVKYSYDDIDSSILLYAVNNMGYQNLMKISSRLKIKKIVELEYLQKTSLGLIAVMPSKYSYVFNNFERSYKFAVEHYKLLKENPNISKEEFFSIIGIEEDTFD